MHVYITLHMHAYITLHSPRSPICLDLSKSSNARFTPHDMLPGSAVKRFVIGNSAVRARAHVCISRCICTCMYIQVGMYLSHIQMAYVHIQMAYVHIQMNMEMCVPSCVCQCTCIYVHAHVHVRINTDVYTHICHKSATRVRPQMDNSKMNINIKRIHTFTHVCSQHKHTCACA